ncbi:MAG: hypothetical protein ACTHLO_01650 [Pseudolabrys sp.]
MSGSTSLGATLARTFLYPGDFVCRVSGLQGDDKRELVRMLVNSLIWIVLGMGAAVVLT